MSYLPAILGAVAAFLLSWGLHTIDVDRIEKENNKRIAAIQVADQKVCDSDKRITMEANDELQKQRDAISARLNSLLVQQPATCIMPLPGAPKLSSGGGTKHAGSHGRGISSTWLRQFAATCEGYRQELKTCINFTNQLPQGDTDEHSR